jgi:hypothetical protein
MPFNSSRGIFCLALCIFLVHKIVLQFCVFPIYLPPVLLVLFSPALLIVCGMQILSQAGSLEVPTLCLGASDFTLV